MGVSINEEDIINYYIVSKGGDLENYETEDLLYLLTSRGYNKLPFIVSRALYRCLGYYKYLHYMYKKTGRVVEYNWRYEGKDRVYRFESRAELPFNQQSKECYIEFYSYYAQERMSLYFKEDIYKRNRYIIEGDKEIHVQPLEIYGTIINRLYENVYFYLGKRETDKIMDDWIEEFGLKIRETEYYSNLDGAEERMRKIDENIPENYRLMRNRTRLNTGEGLR